MYASILIFWPSLSFSCCLSEFGAIISITDAS